MHKLDNYKSLGILVVQDGKEDLQAEEVKTRKTQAQSGSLTNDAYDDSTVVAANVRKLK